MDIEYISLWLALEISNAALIVCLVQGVLILPHAPETMASCLSILASHVLRQSHCIPHRLLVCCSCWRLALQLIQSFRKMGVKTSRIPSWKFFALGLLNYSVGIFNKFMISQLLHVD